MLERVESRHHEGFQILVFKISGSWGKGHYQVESLGFAGPERVRSEPRQTPEGREGMAERWVQAPDI